MRDDAFPRPASEASVRARVGAHDRGRERAQDEAAEERRSRQQEGERREAARGPEARRRHDQS